jgi:hypothetical protein
MPKGINRIASGLRKSAKKSGVKDFKGPVNTRGPLEEKAVKSRIKGLYTSGTSNQVGGKRVDNLLNKKNAAVNPSSATLGSKAARNATTTRRAAEYGQSTETNNPKARTLRSMRSVNRAGLKDAANAAKATSPKMAKIASIARKIPGPVGAAVGIGATLIESMHRKGKDLPRTPKHKSARARKTK